MRPQILAPLALALVLACDSSEPTPATPPPPPATGRPSAPDECRSFVAAYCGRFVDCQPDPMRARADQLAACAAQLQQGGDCAGAVGVSTSFAQCLVDVAGAGCDLIAVTVPDSCRGAVKF
jgi:hypothetical protein